MGQLSLLSQNGTPTDGVWVVSNETEVNDLPQTMRHEGVRATAAFRISAT